MKNKLLYFILSVCLAIVGFGVFSTNVAEAKTTVKYYQNIKNAVYWSLSDEGAIYSTGSLKHRIGTLDLSMGKDGKVTVYYAVHVIKNGKKTVYYKFRYGNRTGWAWRGYFQKDLGMIGNENRYRSVMVKYINKKRAAKKLSPVKMNDTLLNSLADERTTLVSTNKDKWEETPFYESALSYKVNANNIDENCVWSTFGGNYVFLDKADIENDFLDLSDDQYDAIMNPKTQEIGWGFSKVDSNWTVILTKTK